ncbi:MAG: TonB-dependent receptor [Proteobacteria bacterium]|nr:TonB-dependent receptor [Pseudomonadota bacterium]
MTKNPLKIKLLAGVIASVLAVSVPVYAQDTSSAVAGRVVDAKGAPVAGAKIKIVHVPSGTTSTAITDESGRYQARGLRVGGPYHIEAQGAGIKEVDSNNVFLTLGETSTVNLNEAATTAAELQGVTVTANAAQVAVFNSDNKGLSTNISHTQLEAAVNADGSFQNIARMDPRISVTDRDSGQISANGKNFRYNCTTVDQVNAGDPFGLEANGLQSGTTPISQETIDSYQLSTTNFDVSTRGCVGANINAVTKSGTNEFHGSVYYKYRSADTDFMGEIQQIGATTDTPYGGWKREWTAGFTLGGPIVKDTLFFFLAYEKANRIGIGSVSQPSDGGGAGALVTGINSAFFNQALATAKQVGMNPGSLASGANLTAKRYLAKIDWNINDQHRAVFRYNEIKESQPIPTGSANAVTSNSNWYYKNRDPKNYLLQLFSDWSDVFSTEANLQYTHYTQLRGPLEGGFQPTVQVANTTAGFQPSATLGTEYSSQVNALDIKSTYGYFAGTWHLGEHTVKAGVTAQQDKVYNAFLQYAVGQYTYNNSAGANANGALQNFAAGNWYQYQFRMPAPGLSLNDAVAVFKKQQWGVYVQDTWQATDRLSLNYGLRYDAPRFPNSPRLNPCFAAQPGVAFTALGANGKPVCGTNVKTVNGRVVGGGFGYANNATTNGNGTFGPRVSFNYDFDTEYKTQLRGGAGIFVSDVPTVWYSNSFGGTGLTQVGYSITDASNSAPGTLLYSCNGSSFSATKPSASQCATPITYVKQAPSYSGTNPLVPTLGATVPGLGASMNVDTVDPNFQMPSTMQFALGLDRELPWMGLISSLEFNYSKTLHDIQYKSLNMGAPTYTGPDGRQYFCDPSKLQSCSTNSRYYSNPSFGTVTLLTNSRQGQANTLTLMLRKPMSDDWSASLGFRVGHATDVNPGTSSVASSNFNGNVWVNPNSDVATTSNYNVARRVIGSLTWQHRFFGNYLTQVSAFMDLHDGAPYSWISGNNTDGSGVARDLIYIPKSADDVLWAANNTALQKQQFMSYIQNNPYLREHMGQIAGRNALRTAWVNQIDLSFRQQIPGLFEGNKGELRFDFFNFGNLLNSKWGVEKRAPFPLTRALANVNGFDPTTGKYVFDVNQAAFKDANGNYRPQNLQINEGQSGVPNPSQRWSVLMTAKYTF